MSEATAPAHRSERLDAGYPGVQRATSQGSAESAEG